MTDDPQTSPQGYPAQPPGSPLAPRQSPEQPPRARKRSGKTALFIVVAALLGLLACGMLIVGATVVFSPHGKGTVAEPWHLSADQRRVVQEFGPPQTFSVICATDPKNDDLGKDGFSIHRIETWSYHGLGAQFFFRDGRAVGDAHTKGVPAGTNYPKLRPEEFTRGMSVEDVVKVIGAAPTKAADIASDIFKGLEAYVFGDQVMAEFDGGRLVGVQTAPVTPKGDKK